MNLLYIVLYGSGAFVKMIGPLEMSEDVCRRQADELRSPLSKTIRPASSAQRAELLALGPRIQCEWRSGRP